MIESFHSAAQVEPWGRADEGAALVVNKQRDATAIIRTTMTKIVTRAGLKPWPKLFYALRATRATELADSYPGHVAAAWLGRSSTVANKHYRQVTDEHFDQASKCAAKGLNTNEVETAQALFSSVFNSLQLGDICAVGDEGLEAFDASGWVANNLGHEDFRRAAKSGAICADSPFVDGDLGRVIEAWHALTEDIRLRVLAMVRESEG